jgi:hypothetical protein
MFFVHPMWDHESQRIGMQKCRPTAYTLHAVGELIGLIGLLTLLGTIGYMIYVAVFGQFTTVLWLSLLVPFAMGFLSEVMVQVSWKMVAAREFQYDYEKQEASWLEAGQRVTYRYGQVHSEESPPDERASAT